MSVILYITIIKSNNIFKMQDCGTYYLSLSKTTYFLKNVLKIVFYDDNFNNLYINKNILYI